ncbi:2-carboxy-1,4-naphthoquinone phytyltransferase [Thermosynechococcaceae cyanobacterium BACA0444]|uniref:2-carboxy-1,4-naphthoquinone phytyltransferase n=1 Tax=Pseudocalidococcus azoricus BACA0444 TaxID=2918990 RepID=A0AAE4FUF1_9CYAN|nr:2-carboxy-1,4-naphthoquinone phytyltransferase [Pseudocalidococcus azoricus]MDS3861100.1 2-carboxy-1,4-naphthoquinone phytyltransferase [Pseudocalidococcus azoricus BACA0444]
MASTNQPWSPESDPAATSPALAPAPAPSTAGNLWWAALKPPMYSVAVMPIWGGTALAWHLEGTLNAPVFATFLGAAVLILAWLNLTNDVFDSETGIDQNKHHSIVNLTGRKTLIFGIANLCLGLGLVSLAILSVLQGNFVVLGLVLLCCGLGYTYQGPPFRLGYLGLGEPICFVTFGPLAVAAAYYSQAQSWTPLIWPVGIIIGLTTTLILFCSHFHQVKDDLAAGKYSPIVRIGTKTGAIVTQIMIGLVFGLTVLGWGLGQFPVTVLLVLASLPWGIYLGQYVQQYYDIPSMIQSSKFIAVSLHFWSGLLLGLGWIWA